MPVGSAWSAGGERRPGDPPGPLAARWPLLQSVIAVLTSCAGMDVETMSRCPRHEQSATWKLGATLLIPVSLALLAGGYTITTLFGRLSIGIVGAVAWAACIFLIDLAVMATITHRPGESGDRIYRNTPLSRLRAHIGGMLGGHGMSRTLRRFAFMRMLMALVLGTLMSHTLVMGIFHQRVFEEIEANRQVQLADLERKWDKLQAKHDAKRPQLGSSGTDVDSRAANAEKALAEASDSVKEERARVDDIREKLKTRQSELADEINGVGKTCKKQAAGCGPCCAAIKADITRLEKDLAAAENEKRQREADERTKREDFDRVRSEQADIRDRNDQRLRAEHGSKLAAWQKEVDADRVKYERQRAKLEGERRRDLFYQTEAFHRIASQHWSLLVLALFVFLSLFILDLIPLLLKFYRSPGVYDALVVEEERRHLEGAQRGGFEGRDRSTNGGSPP